MVKKPTPAKTASDKKELNPVRLFTFRVALRYKATVWRDIAITEKNNIDNFHECIFSAFERYDDHLWSFFLPPPEEAVLAIPKRGYPRICREIIADTDGDSYRHPVFVGHRARLGKFITQPGMKFAYLFDFGDEWWHIITLVKTEEIDSAEDRKYPKVVATYGKVPSQYPDDDAESRI